MKALYANGNGMQRIDMDCMFEQYGDRTKERVRNRRRKITEARKAKMALRAQTPLIIVIVCMITALTGYISVQGNTVPDTGLAYTAQAEGETIYKTVVVHSGDTLWGIASEYSDPSKDIRKLIKEICALNDIKPGNIYPGQTLMVPISAYLT